MRYSDFCFRGIKKIWLGVMIMFFGFFPFLTVSASWWDDVTDAAEDVECIVDFNFDFNFSFGESEKPVFDGPGLKRGAKLVRCKLDKNISKEKNLPKLIIGWMKFLISLTATVAVVALVYAGFLYVTAMGEDDRIQTAKDIILWTVVGIILILGAYAIVNTIMQARFGAQEYSNNIPPPPSPTSPPPPPAPPSGCIDPGNACSTDSDCCSDLCNGGMCEVERGDTPQGNRF